MSPEQKLAGNRSSGWLQWQIHEGFASWDWPLVFMGFLSRYHGQMVHILDDPDVRSRYFAELRLGKGRTNAAKIIGLKRRIVADYSAKNPDFALDMADAEGEPIDDLYEAALQLAKGIRVNGEDGPYDLPPNLEAVKFLLPRLDRDRFGDKAVVEHQHTYKLENADELAELGERLLRRQRELEQGVIIDVPLALPNTPE